MNNQMKSAGAPRVPALDGIRGLAALFVVLHHCCIYTWAYPEVVISPELMPWAAALRYGGLAVALFIVLSGFVLCMPLATKTYAPPETRKWSSAFLQRRFWRIAPAYFAAIIFSLIPVFRSDGLAGVLKLKWELLWHSLMLHDLGFGSSRSINGAMWSIPVEVHIYFMVPLIVLMWRFISLRASLIIMAIIAGVATILLPTSFAENAAPHFYLLFLAGAAGAMVYASQDKWAERARALPWGWIAAIAITAYAIALIVAGWPRFVTDLVAFEIVFGLVAVAGLIYLALRASVIRSFLQSPPLIALGAVSYSLYLLHMPILENIDGMLNARGIGDTRITRFFWLVAIVVPISLFVATMSYFLIERPFLHLRAAVPHHAGWVSAIRCGLTQRVRWALRLS